MEAVVFVGAQGAGKTSFYRERFLESHVRISLDMLKSRRREQLLLAACLEAKQPFVVDNTNPQPRDRARYVVPARAAGFRPVAYFFEASLREALARNSERQGRQKVPVPGVVNTFKKLQFPSPQEGFDAVYVVTLSSDGFSLRAHSPEGERGSR